MVTPKTCRLCEKPSFTDPLCPACWAAFDAAGEGRRADGIQGEFMLGRITHQSRDWRCDIALEDFITRALAEREVERGRT